MTELNYDGWRAQQDADRAMDAAAGLEAEIDRLLAQLATARAERDSAVRGAAAAVRDLIARVATVEAVCARAETDDDFNFTTDAVRAAIRRDSTENGTGQP